MHPIITVSDIHLYLKESGNFSDILPKMEEYMTRYCIL